MLAYNVTEFDLRAAVTSAAKLYGGNVLLDIRGKSGSAIRFGLKVMDSRGGGAHRGWQGRRSTSACWHAHRDFFSALFEAHPEARVKTAMADYRGRESFLSSFASTGRRNIGSQVQPCWAANACEC